MQAFTHFSRHAFERIGQRTKLSCEEIASILDRGLVFNTGKKPGFNRNHLLFYSEPDDDCYVAIQDGLTGTVVTVLPLDYHGNLAWKVTPDDCAKAKEIYINASTEDTKTKPSSKSTVFIVSGHFLDVGHQKTKTIKKVSSLAYDNNMNNFLSDESFFSKLDEYATDKGVDTSYMFGITIRHGKNGVPVVICLKEVMPPNKSLSPDTSP